MYMTLASTKIAEAFNADYYVAVVTVLPILMLATEVLTNFEKLFQGTETSRLLMPFWFALFLLYCSAPIIAGIGISLGVLALIYRDASSVFQWITFSCLASVAGNK